MPVTPALARVHGVRGEGGVEHICAVDLGAEVAVVAGIVAAHQVAEGCLAVSCLEGLIMRGGGGGGLRYLRGIGEGGERGLTPCITFAEGFGAVELGDFVALYIV